MDVYRFINSKDIAEYLKDLNYKFTLPEASFLVYQSHKTLNEKFEAWQELIDTMPDCSMYERTDMKRIESFHQFLRDYMTLQNKLLQMFYDADGAVYNYETTELLSNGEISASEWPDYFDDAELAIQSYEMGVEEEVFDNMQWVRIFKHPVLLKPYPEDDSRVFEMNVRMSPDLDILNIEVEYSGIEVEYSRGLILPQKEASLLNQFDGMCFAFPTPFKRGDILTYAGTAAKVPFVLDNIHTWNKEDLLDNGYSPRNPKVVSADKHLSDILRNGNKENMNCDVFELETGVSGFPELVRYEDWQYLNLERYEGPLQDKYLALKAVSSAMTYDSEYGEPSITPGLLCNAYQLMLTEQMCKFKRQWMETSYELLGTGYTEEELELAGLK